MLEEVRKDFPTLNQTVNDEPLVYLDNAATTQKPLCVMEAMENYYRLSNANVHRGVHTLSERATTEYEEARETVRAWINARSRKEVLFTRGTTTSLNWIARGYADKFIEEGDEIILSLMEHHANIVPWQQLAMRKKAKLRYVSFDEEGHLNMEELHRMMNDKTKIVALAHVSNVLGVKNDVQTVAKWAHEHDAIMVVDAAQSAPHMKLDVQVLDCDFLAFSGHKMCGPTGIGVLYGKEALLDAMDPVEFGGEMIDFVYENESTWTELPWKFEAGTPPIAEAIGLKTAIEYLDRLGMGSIHQHIQQLMEEALPRLQMIEGVTIYGPHCPDEHEGIIAFNFDGIHPHDAATALDMEGIAVRAGHHCAQPLMRQLQTPATVRASFYLYNTKEDVDRFIDAVIATKEYFSNGII